MTVVRPHQWDEMTGIGTWLELSMSGVILIIPQCVPYCATHKCIVTVYAAYYVNICATGYHVRLDTWWELRGNEPKSGRKLTVTPRQT